jgi:hypothetical protein
MRRSIIYADEAQVLDGAEGVEIAAAIHPYQ